MSLSTEVGKSGVYQVSFGIYIPTLDDNPVITLRTNQRLIAFAGHETDTPLRKYSIIEEEDFKIAAMELRTQALSFDRINPLHHDLAHQVFSSTLEVIPIQHPRYVTLQTITNPAETGRNVLQVPRPKEINDFQLRALLYLSKGIEERNRQPIPRLE